MKRSDGMLGRLGQSRSTRLIALRFCVDMGMGGLRAVTAGIRPVYMKQGIERAVKDIVAKLKKASVPIKCKDDLTKVAAIAANDDRTIGQHLRKTKSMADIY